MKGFLLRIVGGHRDPSVEAEAQRDLQQELKKQVEALRTEHEQLRTEWRTAYARQGVALMSAGLAAWMWHGVARRQAVELARLRARLKVEQLEQTVVIPRRDLHAPTEVRPYQPIHRRR